MPFRIDSATWEITHEVFVVPRPADMIDANFSLSQRIETQQVRALINPAMGRVQDRFSGQWADFLVSHCAIIERQSDPLYFLTIELMKLQQEATSVGLIHDFEHDRPFFPSSVEQLLCLENQLYKTIRVGILVVEAENKQLELGFRLMAVLVVRYTLTTTQIYLDSTVGIDKKEFW
jgi:hypothetical protein